jgi:hypothetical protein
MESLSKSADFKAEELEPGGVQGEIWRRLKVEFPPRVVTHSAKQTFYFDREGLILVPTLGRISKVGVGGLLVAGSPLVDIEIFDAVFE